MESLHTILSVNLAVLAEFGELNQRIRDVRSSTPWLMGLLIIVIGLLLLHGVRTGGRLK